MNCIISFSAEGIVRDADTNNISVFNILEELSGPAFPLFRPMIYYFFLLEREDTDPSTYNLTIRVVNNEQTLLEQPADIDFQGGRRHRHTLKIGGIAIPEPGSLIFRLLQEDQELSTYSIQINSTAQPEATPV